MTPRTSSRETLCLCFVPLRSFPATAQSKHHTLWPERGTCRQPAEDTEELAWVRQASAAKPFHSFIHSFGIQLCWLLFCLARFGTHAENVKEHRSVSLLLHSEDVFRKVGDACGDAQTHHRLRRWLTTWTLDSIRPHSRNCRVLRFIPPPNSFKIPQRLPPRSPLITSPLGPDMRE